MSWVEKLKKASLDHHNEQEANRLAEEKRIEDQIEKQSDVFVKQIEQVLSSLSEDEQKIGKFYGVIGILEDDPVLKCRSLELAQVKVQNQTGIYIPYRSFGDILTNSENSRFKDRKYKCWLNADWSPGPRYESSFPKN